MDAGASSIAGLEGAKQHMPFMVWNDRLFVGIEPVDNDHKEMVAMINELYDGIQTGDAGSILSGILDRLVDYIGTHFSREEKLFEGTAYPGAEQHLREHEKLTHWVLDFQRRFNAGLVAGPSLEAMNYLKDWLFDHILKADQEYVPYVPAQAIR